MEMKLKLNQVLDISHTLRLIIDDSSTKVNTLLKFRLLGLMKAIEPHVSSFEAIRNEKILEYGQKAEDGSYQIAQDNLEAVENFNRDLQSVLTSEVTLTANPLHPQDIFDKGIHAEYLMGLYPIIKENR